MTSDTLTAPAVGVPAEPTTPIKPSEALRLGRLVRPVQVFGHFRDGLLGACAYSAMAIGADGNYELFDQLPKFPRCPACGNGYSGAGMILHFNDDHKWSDDQIVAWLESLGL
jgi:hypothetical protein